MWIAIKNLYQELKESKNSKPFPSIKFLSNLFGKISFLGYSGKFYLYLKINSIYKENIICIF